MFYVDSELDYSSVINSDHRESWGSNQLYPAIVRVHTEMPAQNVPLHWHLGSELVYARHGDVRLFIDGMDVTLRSGQLCLISPKACIPFIQCRMMIHRTCYPYPSMVNTCLACVRN